MREGMFAALSSAPSLRKSDHRLVMIKDDLMQDTRLMTTSYRPNDLLDTQL